jgi:hypothetical protein
VSSPSSNGNAPLVVDVSAYAEVKRANNVLAASATAFLVFADVDDADAAANFDPSFPPTARTPFAMSTLQCDGGFTGGVVAAAPEPLVVRRAPIWKLNESVTREMYSSSVDDGCEHTQRHRIRECLRVRCPTRTTEE